jgi:tRNA modification GTPase
MENGILVLNKSDLAPAGKTPQGAVRVSCLTGEGLDALLDKMVEAAGQRQHAAGQPLAAINARHKALLESARQALRAAGDLVRENNPPELAAVELRAALEALGRIVGSADTEEILGEIFGRFCIGK